METQHLGYILHPPRRGSEPGYSRLDVILAAQASGQHFDPEELHLTVVTPHQGVDELTIQHPWSGSQTYQACAGNLTIADRRGKHLTFFVLGGDLVIEWEDEFTLASLHSPAPVLLQTGARIEIALLTDELESLLAQRRAAREDDPGLFDRHLVAAHPMELYLAMLLALQERYNRLHFGEDEPIAKFKHLLKVEIGAIQEAQPGLFVHALDELL